MSERDCFNLGMEQRSQMQLQWPPVTKTVIGLSIFFFVFWLATVLFEPLRSFADLNMRLTFDSVKEGRFWNVFLYSVNHHGFIEILFVGFAMWMFGAHLEKTLGLKRWWLILISSVILGGWIVVGWDALIGIAAPVQGFHAAVMGLIAAFCWDKWNETIYIFTFPLTGKIMLAACVGFGVVMSAISGQYVRIGLDFAGMVCGILIAGNFLSPRDLKTRFRLWRARRRLKVVRGPEKKDYGPN